MIVYTCAFAFSGPNVLLIRKAKPAWQQGLLNGIGGKVEPGEDVVQATIREFHEETKLPYMGIVPMIYHAMLWRDYETHKGWPLVYFSAFELPQDAVFEAVKNTASDVEPCILMRWNKLDIYQNVLMPNLPFLVEMARCLCSLNPAQRQLRQPVVLDPEYYEALITGGGIPDNRQVPVPGGV